MTYTSGRTWQWLGIIAILLGLGAGYWYFSARAGQQTNTSIATPQGTGRLDSGLTGYFTLDENTGTAAADSSTNAIASLTLTNGPTWTTGQIGSGITFDGTDDYATTADTATLDFADTEDFTLTGWFNRSTFTTDDTIIAKRNGITAADTGYLCYISAADALICEVSDATMSTPSLPPLPSPLRVGITSPSSGIKTRRLGPSFTSMALPMAPPIPAPSETSAPWPMRWLSVSAPKPTTVCPSLAPSMKRGCMTALSQEKRSPTSIASLPPPASIRDLKGYWSFNAQDMYSTTTAYDRSGARNTGTLDERPAKSARQTWPSA